MSVIKVTVFHFFSSTSPTTPAASAYRFVCLLLDDMRTSDTKSLSDDARFVAMKPLLVRFDADQSGGISLAELGAVVKAMGLDVSQSELEEFNGMVRTAWGNRLFVQPFFMFVLRLSW